MIRADVPCEVHRRPHLEMERAHAGIAERDAEQLTVAVAEDVKRRHTGEGQPHHLPISRGPRQVHLIRSGADHAHDAIIATRGGECDRVVGDRDVGIEQNGLGFEEPGELVKVG